MKKVLFFYTNLNSDKSKSIKSNPNVSMCFHWKSLLRQIRIIGNASNISDEEANEYFKSRSYGSKIGGWASPQSSILENRQDIYNSITHYEEKYWNRKTTPTVKRLCFKACPCHNRNNIKKRHSKSLIQILLVTSP